jgi:Na+/H+-dicarboxylate symporter
MHSPARRGLFDWYFKSNLLLRIFIGLALGGAAGWIFGESILWVRPLGDVLLSLLSMIVMPIIFTTLVVGAASISPRSLGRVGVKALAFYLGTSVLAVGLGLAIAGVLRPGAGLELVDAAGATGRELVSPSWRETLMGIIPRNPFQALANGQVLPTIFFAVLLGLSLCFLREHGEERVRKASESLFVLFDAAAEALYLIVRWILQYAPIGVFALVAVVFAEQGAQALGLLGAVTGAAYLGFFVQVFVIYGGLLLLNGLSIRRYLSGAREAIITAFVTRSSSATLPVTMKCCAEMGVSKGIYSFTLPLGTTINMDGTAIYQGICALFIAQAVGAPIGFEQQAAIVITAVLASVGTAGVPAAGAIMLLMVLNSVGMTVEAGSAVAAAYAIILGIDAVLDMGRTGVNVSGDICASLLIAKSEGELDRARWEGRLEDGPAESSGAHPVGGEHPEKGSG